MLKEIKVGSWYFSHKYRGNFKVIKMDGDQIILKKQELGRIKFRRSDSDNNNYIFGKEVVLKFFEPTNPEYVKRFLD